jgi:hypothetical protein
LVSDGYTKVWAFGGVFEDGTYNNSIWELNLWEVPYKGGVEASWRQVKTEGYIQGRVGHSMLLDRSTIYVCGGHNSETIFNDIHAYDICTLIFD